MPVGARLLARLIQKLIRLIYHTPELYFKSLAQVLFLIFLLFILVHKHSDHPGKLRYLFGHLVMGLLQPSFVHVCHHAYDLACQPPPPSRSERALYTAWQAYTSHPCTRPLLSTQAACPVLPQSLKLGEVSLKKDHNLVNFIFVPKISSLLNGWTSTYHWYWPLGLMKVNFSRGSVLLCWISTSLICYCEC